MNRRREVLASLVLALVLAGPLAGCAGGRAPGEPTAPASRTPTGDRVADARELARREYALLSAGDWATAWTLWTVGAQQTLGQRAFVEAISVCPHDLGVPYEIVDARPVDTDTVRVDWRRGPVAGSHTVHFENGGWRFAPAPELLAPPLGCD